ncbi:MAG: hypothetical protein ACOC2O_03000 [Bacillota bacterium]
MEKISLFCSVVLLVFSVLIIFTGKGWAEKGEHPRLYLTGERIDQLQELIEVPETHHYEAFQMMKDRVDQNDPDVYTGHPAKNYRRSWLAREAALMYQLTEKDKYAEIAFDTLKAMYEDPDKEKNLPDNDDVQGLARAMTGIGFAITYDWTYEAWSEKQREFVRDKIIDGLNMWFNFSHPNVEVDHKGSNWVAVCRGAELIMNLAVKGDGVYDDSRQMRKERVEKVIDDLNTHLETAYSKQGWTQEGLGYLHYAFSFLAPAVYAARSVGITDLDQNFESIDFYHLVMLSHSFRENQKMLQSGVGGESVNNEGLASLIFPDVPQKHLGYYKYWYDRHMGIKAPTPSYDENRAATTWALIYYPEEIDSVYPEKTDLDRAVFDLEKGAYYFRNDFQDEDDILVSLLSRNDHHSNAWNQEETFQISLMGFDTTFAKGPGKEREVDKYSKLIVDGESDYDKGKGEVLDYETGDDRSYVIVDGSGNFGLEKALRKFAVDFSGDIQQAGVIDLHDHLEDDQVHDYWWQLRPEKGVKISTDRENNIPMFKLTKGDAYLKGWFVDSPGLEFDSQESLLRVKMSGKEVDYRVIMVIDEGTPPKMSIKDDKIMIGEHQFSSELDEK